MDGRTPTGAIRWVLVRQRGRDRRLARLARPDDVRFRDLVEPVVPTIERALSPRVLANRTGPPAAPSLLVPWRPARRRWRRAIGRATADGGAVVTADVVGCYDAIGPGDVARALRRAGADPRVVERLETWLEALGCAGVPGLPVGPEPSAILANAVLAAGDRALEGIDVRWFRWVDDWVIVAPTSDGAARALDALRAALADVGLALHDAKTAIWPDARAAVEAGLVHQGSPAGAAPSRRRARMA